MPDRSTRRLPDLRRSGNVKLLMQNCVKSFFILKATVTLKCDKLNRKQLIEEILLFPFVAACNGVIPETVPMQFSYPNIVCKAGSCIGG